MLCQLEVPDEVVLAAARGASFFALNAAPARPVELEPDLLIVNRLEHEVVSRGRLVAVTLGAEGGVLIEDGRQVAAASVARDRGGRRHRRRRCVRRLPRRLAARGAAARGRAAPGLLRRARSPRRGSARRASLPTAAELEAWLRLSAPTPILARLRPRPRRRDRPAARARLARGRARRRHDRRGQLDPRQDDRERLAGARVRGPRRRPRRCRRGAAARPGAGRGGARPRRDGAGRAGPAAAGRRADRGARGVVPRRADPRPRRRGSRWSRSGR